MLRATISTSSKQAQKYFKESLAQSDYYQEQGTSLGIWGGLAAEKLGLQGTVEQKAFIALTENRHPRSGEKLSTQDRANRRVGTDFTFNPPKSFSVAALHDPELEAVLLKAVQNTMAAMEQHVQVRVRGKEATQEDQNRDTGNWVYAAFQHNTTRPLADGTADIHLHVHAYAFNLSYDTVSQKWKAAQLGLVNERLPYYQARFHSELACEVQKLGYGIQTDGRGGWEINGLKPETLEKFSRRTSEIEAEAKRKNITNASWLDRLGALTRRKKVAKPLSPEAQKAEWMARLTPEERRDLATLKGRPNQTVAQDAKQALAYALDHHLERTSTVDAYQLQATALNQGLGVANPAQMEDAIAKRKDLVWGRDERPQVTTEAVYDEEQSVIKYAREGIWACRPLAYHTANIESPQLKQVLESPHLITVIEGLAGTGKTTLIKEAASKMAEAGNKVFLFAPTAEASRGVLVKEGFTEAETLAKLLTDKNLQAQTKGAVLWVDEAGLMGNKQFYALCKLAKENGNRLVLSGDAKQHSSIQRGAPLDMLRLHAGLEPVRLTDIKRQRGEYKEAVQSIVGGDLDKAFDKLERLGAFQELDPKTGYEKVAKAYASGLESKESVLIVCPTHKEGEAVTEAVRKELQRKGSLGTEEQSMLRLQAVDSTEAQRTQAHFYKPQLVVQFTLPAKGFQRGARAVVMAADNKQVKVLLPTGEEKTLPLHQPERFAVYEQKPLKLAVGDKLRITQNAYLDGKRLNNGAMHEVVAFDKMRQPILDNGMKLPCDFGHWSHSYVLTSNNSQGKTVDKVLLVQSAQSFGAASLNQFYVSVSRGRKAVQVFTDSKVELLKAVRDPELRRLASVLSPNPKPTMQERIKQAVQDITTRMRFMATRNQHRAHAQRQTQLTQSHVGQVR
jgi:conjugative relaxase-like TrwC/TraI family protein